MIRSPIIAAVASLVLAFGLSTPVVAVTPLPPVQPFGNGPAAYDKDSEQLIRVLLERVRAAPPKSTIKVATYLLDSPPLGKELIAAHRRGVGVQVVINKLSSSQTIRDLTKEFGGRAPGKRSWLIRTAGSGLHPSGDMHFKGWAFSSTRDVVLGSANANPGNTVSSWNFNTVIRSEKVYRSVTAYIDAIMAGQRRSYYRGHTVSDKGQTVVFFPGAPDLILRDLKRVNRRSECRPLRIDTFQWTNAGGMVRRAREVRRIARLCSGKMVPQVVINYREDGTSTRTLYGRKVAQQLMARGRGRVDVRNALVPSRSYTHGKNIEVGGRLFHGSKNWNDTAAHNADSWIISTDAATRREWEDHWRKLWAASKPYRGIPPVIVSPAEVEDDHGDSPW